MSAYREVELRCDGIEGNPYGCQFVIYAHTGRRARREARERGWLVSQPGGKDFCPEHRPATHPAALSQPSNEGDNHG